LYRRLRRTLSHESIFQDAVATLKKLGEKEDESLDEDRAYQFFVLAWMGINGIMGMDKPSYSFSFRYSTSGGDSAGRWHSAVRSIPIWMERLRNVTILRRNGLELLEKVWDDKNTVIYVDPPYIVKGTQYKHDFTMVEHEHLAVLLKRFQHTRVVLSYYEHPLVRSLYEGWTVVSKKRLKGMGSTGKKKNKADSPELLLINGPSITYKSKQCFGMSDRLRGNVFME
jgi:DNA adenine methylase